MVDRAAGRHPEDVIRDALHLVNDCGVGIREEEAIKQALAALDSLARQHQTMKTALEDLEDVARAAASWAPTAGSKAWLSQRIDQAVALSAGGADTQEGAG